MSCDGLEACSGGIPCQCDAIRYILSHFLTQINTLCCLWFLMAVSCQWLAAQLRITSPKLEAMSISGAVTYNPCFALLWNLFILRWAWPTANWNTSQTWCLRVRSQDFDFQHFASRYQSPDDQGEKGRDETTEKRTRDVIRIAKGGGL